LRKAFVAGFVALFTQCGLPQSTEAQAHPRSSTTGSQEPGAPTHSWSFLPFAAYSPETSLSFGGLAARIAEDDDGTIVSSLTSSAQYTLKGQAVLSGRYEAWSGGGWRILLDASGKLKWPDRLYPPGNQAGIEDYEEWTSRGVEFKASFQRRTFSPFLFLGPVLEFSTLQIREKEDGGLLDQGLIPGAEDHGLFGLGVSATWDSRDSPIFPRTGAFHTLSLTGHGSFQGVNRWFGRGEADLRVYLPLGETSVLALRGRVRSARGDVPFSMYAPIGGVAGGLRGIYQVRYTSAAAGIAVAELRLPLAGRFSWVAFGGMGQVGSSTRSFGWKGIHWAGGGGIRFGLMPESGLNVGVDLGFGEGETNVYFVLGEVF
jgi:hypothetical protein